MTNASTLGRRLKPSEKSFKDHKTIKIMSLKTKQMEKNSQRLSIKYAAVMLVVREMVLMIRLSVLSARRRK
jgi:hypothetical protein